MSKWNISVEPPSGFESSEVMFSSKKEVEHWVESLPAAAPGKTFQQLHHALQTIAQQPIGPAVRFCFLERIAPLFVGILYSMEKEVYREGFPLNQKNAQIARLLLTSLGLAIVNYRLVLNGLHDSLLAGGLKRRHIHGHTLLRCMELLTEVFELYRHLDLKPSSGLWLLFNSLFLIAESDKLLKRPLNAIDGESTTTIASTFILRQLLGPLNPHDFRHQEYVCAMKAIRIWSTMLSCQYSGKPDDPNSFCLHLNEDAPLSFFEPVRLEQHRDSRYRRCLNLQPIRAALQGFLDKGAQGSAIEGCQLSRHAAHRMLSGWQVIADNRSEREEMSGEIRLVHGLSNISRVVLQQQFSHSDTPANPALAIDDEDYEEVVMESSKPNFGGFAADIIHPDEQQSTSEDELWNASYINIVQPSPHWVKGFRTEQDASLLHGQLLNQSPTGYGVQLTDIDSTFKFQIGDLAAIAMNGDWHLCTIRWIRHQENQLQLGLRTLGNELYTEALVISRQGRPSPAMPVLLITHTSGVSAIVMHNINIHPQDEITFVDSKARAKLQIGELLETSGTFECYQLDRQPL